MGGKDGGRKLYNKLVTKHHTVPIARLKLTTRQGRRGRRGGGEGGGGGGGGGGEEGEEGEDGEVWLATT